MTTCEFRALIVCHVAFDFFIAIANSLIIPGKELINSIDLFLILFNPVFKIILRFCLAPFNKFNRDRLESLSTK